MPCDPWEQVAGEKCDMCGGYATHIYGVNYLCCECHGGCLVTQKEAKKMHEKFLKGKKKWRYNKFKEDDYGNVPPEFF